MSKTAIKTGRYTHQKKTKDIEEVKRLQLVEKMKADGQTVIETQEEELEKIIEHITTVHKQQTPHTPEFFEKLPEKEKEFMVWFFSLFKFKMCTSGVRFVCHFLKIGV